MNQKEKREKRTFKRELNSLTRAIKVKRFKLWLEKLKGKKADQNLIAELQKEITLLDKNAAELQKIKAQLTQSHEMIDLEIQRLKQLIQTIVNVAKSQRRYRKKLNEREGDLKKQINELKKRQEKVAESIETFNSAEQIYTVVLAFSQNLSSFFNYYTTILKEDIKFEEKLKEIVLQNILVEQQFLVFAKLLTSLSEIEKAIDQGTEAILSLLNIIFNTDVSGSLLRERKKLLDQSAILNYEERVEQQLQALDQEMTLKSEAATVKLDQLIAKEKRTLNENQALHESEARHLADAMATMVNRKIAIDQKYLGEAVKFGDQLEKRNQIAGASYKEALNAV